MAGRKPAELQNQPRALRALTDWGTLPAAVKWHIDGDTFGALLDSGGGRYAYETVRLAGIEAEPLGTEAGDRAAARLAELLPEGTHVLLRSVDFDRYGRLVCRVLYGAGADLSDALLGEGLVRPYEAA